MSDLSSHQSQLAALASQLGLLRRLVVALVIAVVLLGGFVVRSALRSGEITVQRINVVEPDGTLRLTISNSARFPEPLVAGKKYKRAVAPAGMVFYDAKGSEMGGLALTDAAMGRVSALAFDYPNYDAMGFMTAISADGKTATTGVSINSRPPGQMSLPEAAQVVQQRVLLQNRDENAELILKDAQGADRLRLRVDDHGEAALEFLDAKGAVTFRLPQSAGK